MEGEVVRPPKPLAWYPNNLAWQLDMSRSHLRKIPEMKEIHEFIKAETEIGAITRQEAVSMIPPCVLQVRAILAIEWTRRGNNEEMLQVVDETEFSVQVEGRTIT